MKRSENRGRKLVASVLAVAVGTAGIMIGSGLALAQETKLTFGHIYTTATPNHAAAEIFARRLAELTGGKAKVEVFPGGQMGQERELVDSISVGSIDLGDVSAGVLATVFPKVNLFAAPYVFKDAAHQQEVVDGPIGKAIYDELRAKAGIRILASYYQPPRHLTANREIKDAAAVKGIKIRVPEVPLWTRYWRAAGANPTPINWGEVYTSLQLGVVEAQENPFIYIDSGKLYEVQKSLMLTGHVRNMEWILMSEARFAKLPKDIQAAVVEAGKAAETFLNDKWRSDNERLERKLTEAGMKKVVPDVESFRRVMMDNYKEILGTDELSALFTQVNGTVK